MVTAKRVVSFLETPNPRGLSSKQLLLENEDLKPVERQRRLWTAKVPQDPRTDARSFTDGLAFSPWSFLVLPVLPGPQPKIDPCDPKNLPGSPNASNDSRSRFSG